MQFLGSQKPHFLDFLTARVVDMNSLPPIRCILKRFGGWKWSSSYPPTLFWWLSCKQGHSDKVFQQQCYRVILSKGPCSSAKSPVPWMARRSRVVAVKVAATAAATVSESSWSGFLISSDCSYELILLMVNSTMLFWESFLEAQSKTCSSMYVCMYKHLIPCSESFSA